MYIVVVIIQELHQPPKRYDDKSHVLRAGQPPATQQYQQKPCMLSACSMHIGAPEVMLIRAARNHITALLLDDEDNDVRRRRSTSRVSRSLVAEVSDDNESLVDYNQSEAEYCGVSSRVWSCFLFITNHVHLGATD